jgi:Mrp family chromosome partitioning ATPase
MDFYNWLLYLKKAVTPKWISGTSIIMNISEEAYSSHKEHESISNSLSNTQNLQTDSQRVTKREPQPASPESLDSRFNPRIQFNNLSTPYPEMLYKIHDHLSDIWANIMVETKQKVETLLVAGATHNEGNTFVSFYLSLFLSKEYRMKILYVDTNLNHAVIPNIHSLPGLYSFVSEKKELSSLIVQSEYPGLFLLPSGAGEIATNVGANSLSREPIQSLIAYCRENFDMTIIDGQPLTLSPIMIEFAKMVDMTALVCRYGYSRWEVSKQAVDKLRKFGVTSIGVILNDRQLPIPQKIYRIMG